jgi:nitrogen-specific signal transduction histidine kinase
VKRFSLTLLIIGFVLLIVLFQSYLIFNLYALQKNIIIKEINTILKETYIEDVNNRIRDASKKQENELHVFKGSDALPDETVAVYNLDENDLIDKNDHIALINMALVQYANAQQPLDICTLDSCVAFRLKEKELAIDFYLQIIDNKGECVKISKVTIPESTSFLIHSQPIPLNFDKTEHLELVLLNPLHLVFKKLYLIIFSCLLFSLFCMYCLWQLQRMFFKQRQLAALKNDFFSQISHELKRPLSQIYMAIQALHDPLIVSNESKRNKYLDISRKASKDVSGKIDMIRDLSMMEEGIFHLNYSVFNLQESLCLLIEDIKLTASKSVQIRMNNKLENPFIRADKEHFTQCVSNLLENAIKYSSESVALIITAYIVDNHLLVSVEDNGWGIKEQDLSVIFEKYQRIDNHREKVEGSGIGLFYVKTIMEMHHGRIEVTSVTSMLICRK